MVYCQNHVHFIEANVCSAPATLIRSAFENECRVTNFSFASVKGSQKYAKVFSVIGHLTEQTIANAARQLLGLRNLVGDPLLLVELLGQRLQFSEGELQGQAVHMALGRVLQHVLK